MLYLFISTQVECYELRKRSYTTVYGENTVVLVRIWRETDQNGDRMQSPYAVVYERAYSTWAYQWKMYNDITNNFRDGLFINVTQISLYDEHPFEYEFFLRISKSFPFIKELTIFNLKAQQNKSNIINY